MSTVSSTMRPLVSVLCTGHLVVTRTSAAICSLVRSPLKRMRRRDDLLPESFYGTHGDSVQDPDSLPFVVVMEPRML